MTNSNLFNLNWSDVLKGLVMAVLGGVVLPVLAVLQTPGFDISHANWHAIFILAINGGIAAFAAYIVKNLLSDSNGKVLGAIG